tara:strand:- start:832 stop:1062 length:231 start_codon:yes stop_codon:yes gene_type:complete
MYARTKMQSPTQEKNPNRVLGGLKGQGVNSFSMLGEDGIEKEIPTQAYVQALEEKLRTQDSRIAVLEKQIRRLSNG